MEDSPNHHSPPNPQPILEMAVLQDTVRALNQWLLNQSEDMRILKEKIRRLRYTISVSNVDDVANSECVMITDKNTDAAERRDERRRHSIDDSNSDSECFSVVHKGKKLARKNFTPFPGPNLPRIIVVPQFLWPATIYRPLHRN